MRGAEYDDFVERFVAAVTQRWPHVLLQWEDFASDNAGRLLERYRDRLCTFNDDIQGTAAVAAGALLARHQRHRRSAARPAHRRGRRGFGRVRHQPAVDGAMIEGGLSQAEARAGFYLVDRDGLLVEGMSGILPFQQPFAQPRAARIAAWHVARQDRAGSTLSRIARPTVLIGVSGQAGAFTEPVIARDGAACRAARHLPAFQPDQP